MRGWGGVYVCKGLENPEKQRAERSQDSRGVRGSAGSWAVPKQASIRSGGGLGGRSRRHPGRPPSALHHLPHPFRQDPLRAGGRLGLPVWGRKGRGGGQAGLAQVAALEARGVEGGLTFSVSRSFTVGNGVRADILRGRRGRAGGPAGRGPQRASARAGAREQAAPGSARLPQAAGREGGRGRGDRAAGTPVGRGGPRRADWRAGARELPQRGARRARP